jgi:hypothetical protein
VCKQTVCLVIARKTWIHPAEFLAEPVHDPASTVGNADCWSTGRAVGE